LTVYYTNPADLKQIFVRATGGRGARGGRRAEGGRGCNCRDRNWKSKPVRGLQGVLTIVAKLVSSLAKMAMMAAMAAMVGMGVMELWAASR
jgi:hypothetical protein